MLPRQVQAEILKIDDLEIETDKLIPIEDRPDYDFASFFFHMQHKVAIRHHIDDETDEEPSNPTRTFARLLRKCVPTESLKQLIHKATNTPAHKRMDYQLALADCYMFGLKGAKRDYQRASSLYYEAARGGLPEACIACAMIAYFALVGVPTGPDISVPRISPNSPKFPLLRQMWFYLDASVERNWLCPFFLRRAEDAISNGSWELSDVAKDAFRRRKEDVERETKDEHKVRCGRADCVIRLASTSQLKRCSRCRAVSYCSTACQHADWRERHKAVCRPYAASSSSQEEMTESSTEKNDPQNSVNLTLDGISISSTTFTADELNAVGNAWVLDRIKLLCEIRGHPGLPPLEYEELMRQARGLMDRNEYASAKRCLTRAADDLWRSKPVFGGEPDERLAMLRILRLSITCSLALSKKHSSETDVDSAIEDLELLLSTGIFPLEEMEPDVLEDLRRLETQAKLQKARVAEDDIPVQAPRSQIQAPQSQIQAPQSQIQAPQSQIQAPQSQIQATQSQIQAPQSQIQAPQSQIQAPQPQIRRSNNGRSNNGRSNNGRSNNGRSNNGRSNNGRKKNKKKKPIKQDDPDVIICPTEELKLLGVATNVASSDDGCTICLTAWTDFPSLTLAVIPPCQHATCAPCLSRFRKACKISFETETSTKRAKVSFSCVLCRSVLPDALIDSAARLTVRRNVVPAFKDLAQQLGILDAEDRHRLLTSLLVAHNFDIPQVTDVLFQMVGVVTSSSDSGQDLTHDEKQRIYETAREPVRKLLEEHRALRATLATSYESDLPEWRATLARAQEVSEALTNARTNAAADIFERVNAAGKMGRGGEPNIIVDTTTGPEPIHVDLHGLHVEEARLALHDFVFPTLPVLRTVNVICGRGSHSKDGEGVLRDLVRNAAAEKGFHVKKNSNPGVLTIRM